MRQSNRRKEGNILHVIKTKEIVKLWIGKRTGSVKDIFQQKILWLYSLSFHVHLKLLRWVP